MKMFPMVPQSSLLFKLLIIAHFAFEFVLGPVDVHVLRQEILLGELHPTNVTSVNLDRFTDQRMVGMLFCLMDDQLDLLVVNLLANDALELSI